MAVEFRKDATKLNPDDPSFEKMHRDLITSAEEAERRGNRLYRQHLQDLLDAGGLDADAEERLRQEIAGLDEILGEE